MKAMKPRACLSVQADADLPREFGVGHRHEGRHFLVPDLDEVDLAGQLQPPMTPLILSPGYP